MMNSFAFAYPFALLAIPVSLLALWFAYKAGGKEKSIRVPTLLFLKHFEGAPSAKNKFFPPPRAFFFLLICLLFIAVSAGIYARQEKAAKIFLLDNSLSSALLQPQGQSALDLLKRSLTLEETGFAEKIAYYVTCPSLLEISRTQLDELSHGFCQDNLEEKVSSLLTKYPQSSIVVFTQRSVARANASSATSSSDYGRIAVRNAGTVSRANIAILGASVQEGKPAKISVRVSSFAEQDLQASLDLQVLAGKNWQTVGKQDFNLSAKERSLVELPLAATITQPLRVALRVASEANYLLEDDLWYLLPPSKQSNEGRKIAVISPNEIKQLGLDGISGLAFEKINQEQLKLKISDYSAVVSHRQLSSIDLPISQLVILPLVSELIDSGEITRFEKSHPILAYINPRSITLQRQIRLPVLPEAKTLISTSKGLALTTIERNFEGRSIRSANIAFELLPFEGRNTLGSSILFLNLMSWILQSELGSSTLTTPHVVTSDKPFKVINSAGIELEKSQNRVLLETPSVYLLEEQDKSAKWLAVNFSSQTESNTLEIPSWNLPRTSSSSTTSEADPENNSRLLIIILLIILLSLVIEGFFSKKIGLTLSRVSGFIRGRLRA